MQTSQIIGQVKSKDRPFNYETEKRKSLNLINDIKDKYLSFLNKNFKNLGGSPQPKSEMTISQKLEGDQGKFERKLMFQSQINLQKEKMKESESMFELQKVKQVKQIGTMQDKSFLMGQLSILHEQIKDHKSILDSQKREIVVQSSILDQNKA